VKIAGMRDRLLAAVAGATLLTASALAGGAPTASALAGAPAAGALAGGPAAAPGTAHPGPRAAALARILRLGPGRAGRPGLGLAGLAGHGLRAQALPKGGRDLPEPGTASLLQGVSCLSSSDCWAVGTYNPGGDFDLNEVLHWNGSAWIQVPAPSPGGSASGSLSLLISVRCAAVSDCWAVGVTERNGGAQLNQALHWNGTKWSVKPTPQPGGSLSSDINELFEVGCTSSASCWAAGRYGTQAGGTVLLNQLLHWNGKKWSLATVPNPGGTESGDVNEVNAVRCTSAGNCLAAGSYGTTSLMVNEALHWNGATWSQVSVPNPGGSTGTGTFNELDSLACSSATNCWAVGFYGSLTTELRVNQALHWNGSAWTQVATPEPDGTGIGASQNLTGVACKTATNCWAVGSYASASGAILDQALHWDGGAWTLVDTPEPGGGAVGDNNDLVTVRCNSSADCWAVGGAQMSGGQLFGQALHWNGTTWSIG